MLNPVLAMHMSDALVSAKVGGIMWVVFLLLLLYSAKKASQNFDKLNIPLMGVMAAFVFAAQMLNFSIPATGSSGHIGGGILLAATLGAYPAFIALSSVLFIQALFFADGGILAFGCNAFNMAFFACFVAYPLLFVSIVRKSRGKFAIIAAGVLSCVLTLQCGSFCVVLETLCSDITELDFKTFLLFMQPIHLAIGLVEGVATAFVLLAIKDSNAFVFNKLTEGKFMPSKKSAVLLMSIAAVVFGSLFSIYASEKPDGLEWSLQNTAKTEIAAEKSAAHLASKNIANNTAIFSDYSTPMLGGKASTSVAGLMGSLITAAFLFVGYFAFKFVSKTNLNGK